MPKPITQHRSQAPALPRRIRVTSPALRRWQVALILGVTERTVRNWEKSILTAQRFGRIVRYPAKENGLSDCIEVVTDPSETTPRPKQAQPRP